MITIKPEQFGSYIRSSSERFRKAALRGVRRGAVRCLGMVKVRTSNLRPSAPVNTGRYKSAWKYMEILKGGVVYNESPQAGPLELGVRPGRIPLPKKATKGGWIPMGALRSWVQQRLMRGGSKAAIKVSSRGIKRRLDRKLGKYTSPLVQVLRKQLSAKYMRRRREGVAWAVAIGVQRKLHEAGMTARRVLTDPRFVAGQTRVVSKEIGRALTEAARG